MILSAQQLATKDEPGAETAEPLKSLRDGPLARTERTDERAIAVRKERLCDCPGTIVARRS